MQFFLAPPGISMKSGVLFCEASVAQPVDNGAEASGRRRLLERGPLEGSGGEICQMTLASDNRRWDQTVRSLWTGTNHQRP
jgi:hypothetical protein